MTAKVRCGVPALRDGERMAVLRPADAETAAQLLEEARTRVGVDITTEAFSELLLREPKQYLGILGHTDRTSSARPCIIDPETFAIIGETELGDVLVPASQLEDKRITMAIEDFRGLDPDEVGILGGVKPEPFKN